MDEIGAARSGRLPALVSRGDIRGDLHMHTDWSDGRDSVATMAETAHGLGYEYIAITDHSPHSGATRNLTADAVRRQADEIAAERQRYPGMTILHGCEVDIMADGRLDFRDSILEQFDIVLASLHERHGHSPEQLLARYIAAMRHPLVAMVTHPTDRLIPYRLGYELDYDRLFETAVETGTLVEDRRRAVPSRSRRRARAPGGDRRRDRRHRQRLSSRGDAESPNALRDH